VTTAWAVARGASWATPVTENREPMYTQFRRAVAPEKEADGATGFRILVSLIKR
jgi:hypothetical protein